MIALVPVRAGELPGGAGEAVAEAGGRVLVAGEETAAAAEALGALLGGGLRSVRVAELGRFGPARFAALLAPVLADEAVVVVPATPDGRDLAPRLAAALGRPLVAGAVEVRADSAVVVRHGGRQLRTVRAIGPFVATLQTQARALPLPAGGEPAAAEVLELPAEAPAGALDPEVVEVLEADPATVELAEAERILAGGAGLGGAEQFALLATVAGRLGASVGATRVVTDAGVLGHDRQIGTTGVTVRPRCYLAFGISGAVQHVGGIGEPEHVIAVNLDGSCPMMAMADLAVVADAPATLAALAELLDAEAAPRG